MKNIKNFKKAGFFKKIFIKICRKLGYEIIDQNQFEIVTLNKKINEQVSDIGQNSINLPLGKVKITRPVKALDIIIRTCSNVNMLTQNKARLFEREKIEILDIGTKNINEFVSISFVIANEKFEETIKNSLKPHFISED